MRELEAWPSPLISEWMAYHMIEPLPDANWHTGLLASMMANLWSKGAKTKPEDFIPRVAPRRRSPEELLAKFRVVAATINALNKG